MQFITKKVLSSLCQYVNKMLQEFCHTYHHAARWVHYTESAVCSCYENLAVGCSPLEGNSFQSCIILYYIFVRTYTNLWGTKIKPLDIYIYFFYTRSPDLNLTVTPRLQGKHFILYASFQDSWQVGAAWRTSFVFFCGKLADMRARRTTAPLTSRCRQRSLSHSPKMELTSVCFLHPCAPLSHFKKHVLWLLKWWQPTSYSPQGPWWCHTLNWNGEQG